MLLFTHPYLTNYDAFLQKRVQDLHRLDQCGSIKLLEQGCKAVEDASLILKTAPLRERLSLSQLIKLIGSHPRLASKVPPRIIAKLNNGDQIVPLISDRTDLADLLSQADIRTKLNADHIEEIALHSAQNAKLIFDDELADRLRDQVINQLCLIFPSIGRHYEQFPRLLDALSRRKVLALAGSSQIIYNDFCRRYGSLPQLADSDLYALDSHEEVAVLILNKAARSLPFINHELIKSVTRICIKHPRLAEQFFSKPINAPLFSKEAALESLSFARFALRTFDFEDNVRNKIIDSHAELCIAELEANPNIPTKILYKRCTQHRSFLEKIMTNSQQLDRFSPKQLVDLCDISKDFRDLLIKSSSLRSKLSKKQLIEIEIWVGETEALSIAKTEWPLLSRKGKSYLMMQIPNLLKHIEGSREFRVTTSEHAEMGHFDFIGLNRLSDAWFRTGLDICLEYMREPVCESVALQIIESFKATMSLKNLMTLCENPLVLRYVQKNPELVKTFDINHNEIPFWCFGISKEPLSIPEREAYTFMTKLFDEFDKPQEPDIPASPAQQAAPAAPYPIVSLDYFSIDIADHVDDEDHASSRSSCNIC